MFFLYLLISFSIIKETQQFCENPFISKCKHLTALSVDNTNGDIGKHFNFNAVDLNNILERSDWNGQNIKVYFSSQFYYMDFFNTNDGGSAGDSYGIVNDPQYTFTNFQIGDEIFFDNIPESCLGQNRQASIVGQCNCNLNYVNITGNDCQQCTYEGCATCNETVCLTCLGVQSASNSRVANNQGELTCICPQGYYSDINVSNDCQQCINTCLECVNGTECTVCKGTLNVDSSRGVNYQTQVNDCTCPRGYYSILGTSDDCLSCRDHFEGCDTCDDGTQCTACLGDKDEDYSRIANPDTSLLECICPITYYSKLPAENNCAQCPYEGCATCNETVCLTCLGIKDADNSRTVNDLGQLTCACPQGYYSDISVSNDCQQCMETCLECVNGTECTVCKGTLNIDSSRGVNYQTQVNDCTCPRGYYSILGTSDECQLCRDHFEGCDTCDDGTQCTACLGDQDEDYSRIANPDTNLLECICPITYYSKIPTEYNCAKCPHEGCATCNETVCLTCLGIKDSDNSRNVNDLGQLTCVCPQGYYSDMSVSNDCQQCMETCLECLNGTECTVCKGTLDIDSSRGINYQTQVNDCTCPRGYYSILGTSDECQACRDHFEGCDTCNDGTQCTACLGDQGEDYSRITNPNTSLLECICPINYYSKLPTEDNCAQCPYEGCATCNETVCLTCLGIKDADNSRNVNGLGQLTCVCPQGYYSDMSVSNDCQQCMETCLECLNGTECTVCKGTLNIDSSRGINYQTQVNDCTCPRGYYSILGTSDECQACRDHFEGCDTCNDGTQCTACLGDQGEDYSRITNPNTSLLECICPINYYSKLPTEDNCAQCPYEGCATCNETVCLTCLGIKDADNSRNVNGLGQLTCACPQGYYSDLSVSNDCQQCMETCLECLNGTECTVCKGTLNIDSSRGINYQTQVNDCTCPRGYYSILGTSDECQACRDHFEGCDTCDDGTQCTACLGDQGEDYSRIANPDTSLLECICPITYYSKLPSENNCAECSHEGCATCNETVCLTCLGIQDADKSRTVNDSGQLTCVCPQGYYSDMSISNDCQQCMETCLECVNGTECTVCKGTLNIDSSRGVNYQTQVNDCTCPRGYYSILGTSDECQACRDHFEGCDTCDDGTQCTACLGDQGEDYSRIANPDTSLLECICPITYYSKLPAENNCAVCPHEGCATCSETVCLTCLGIKDANNSRTVNDLGQLTCACPQGYYSDISVSNDCQQCMETCLKCLNGTECTVCKGTLDIDSSRGENYLTQVYDCTCPRGYYSILGTSDECQSCRDHFEGCDTCDDGTQCTACLGDQGESYSRISNPDTSLLECICPISHYSNLPTEDNCVECPYEGCATCNSSQCLTCLGIKDADNSRIANDQELLTCICPQGYYSDLSVSNDCQQCMETCLECVNGTECTICKGTLNEDFSRGQNYLTQVYDCTCPRGYYSILGTSDECQACRDHFEGCDTCDDGSQCTLCLGDQNQPHSRISNPDTSLLECICPISHYSNLPTEDNCVECPYEGCATCNSSQCLTCLGIKDADNSRIADDQGLLTCICPQNYFSNLNVSNDCQECLETCLECVKGDECTVCKGTLNEVFSRGQNYVTLVYDCTCPRGYYSILGTSDECQSCIENFEGCDTCDDATQCTLCLGDQNQPHSRIANPDNGLLECICPISYYSNLPAEKNCIKCKYEGCATCNALNCLTCLGVEYEEHSRATDETGLLSCVCPKGYYSDLSVSNDCLKCLEGCIECENGYSCKGDCKGSLNEDFSRGFNFETNVYDCTCPRGYYSVISQYITDECQSCKDNFLSCDTCADQTECTLCIGTQGAEQSRIVNPVTSKNECICPLNYYSDISIQDDCIKCKYEGCKYCEDQISCTVCFGTQGETNSRIPGDEVSINQCKCPVNQYSDLSISENCLQCKFEACLTCNETDCIICKGDQDEIYSRVGSSSSVFDCVCPDGYYSDFTNSDNCFICPFVQCATCENGIECLKCIGVQGQQKSRIINPENNLNECVCPYNYYEDIENRGPDCIQCAFKACKHCNNDIDCTVCVGDLGKSYSRISKIINDGERDIEINECICPPKHFSDLSLQENCMKCDFQCEECINDFQQCTKCIGVRDLEINCHCHRGFYDSRVDIDCLPCESGCEHCDKDQCFVCIANKYNHNPGTDMTCDCLGPNHLDHTGITEYCTNCDTMVFKKIQFNDDYLGIKIHFYDEVVFRNIFYDVNSYTKHFCRDLFENDTQKLIGKGSQCKLDDTNKIISIKFGTNPTVLIDDIFNFKLNFLQRKVCLESQYISDFHENHVVQAENPVQPLALFTKLGDSLSVCDTIQVNNNQIGNDGNRGLFNFTWTVEYTTSTDTTDLDNLLELNTLNKFNYLIIPPLTLQNGHEYEIQVSYENIGYQIGFTILKFATLQYRSGISAFVIQTRPFVFRNFQQNEVQAAINFLDCGGGEFTQVSQSLNITWYDNEDEDNPQYIKSILTDPDESVGTFIIEKYTQTPGQVYNIKAIVQTPDEVLSQTLYFQYEILQSSLIADIEGGNRLQSYSKEMKINGRGYDPDLNLEIQEQDIEHLWECVDMGKSKPCETILGDQLTFNQTKTVYFEARLFEPYSSLQFIYNITKQDREMVQDIVVLVIIEDELPELVVTVPEAFKTQKINLNDDLQVSILTDNDPDEVYFSIILLYDLEIVATKSFKYNVMAFKIWDIFSDFNLADNELLIRVSMYNPQFFMPSQSNFNIQINFEPQEGQIIITPSSGIGLETDFNILLEGFKDQDLPLSYKYYFYLQASDYLADVQKGENPVEVNKNILNDYTNVNQIDTKLPSGKLIIDGENNELYQILIMVSVSDSLGAVRNVTQTLDVNPNPKKFNSQLQQYKKDINEIKLQPVELQIRYLNLLTLEIADLGAPNCENDCSGDGECVDIDSEPTCQCNEGFYLQDCSQGQGIDTYQSIIKEVFNLLQEYLEIASSQAIKDQIQKSINMISENKDLNEILEEGELDKKVELQKKVIKEQKNILKSIFKSGLMNQGNNIISNKLKQAKEILGKGYKNMDSSFKNLKYLKKRRKLTDGESLNAQEQIINIGSSTTEQLEQVLLPNDDPIEYSGTNVKLKAQKLTYTQIYNQYFESSQIYLEQHYNSRFLQEDESVVQNDGEDGEDGENDGEIDYTTKIFTSSQSTYKNNPFKEEKEFPYPDQDLGLIDVVLKTVEQNTDTKQFDIRQSLNVRFDAIVNATNIKCITRTQNRQWKNEYCQPSEKEGSDGQPQINCSCKSLVPVTVVDDINNLFEDSLISSVFSDEGITALENFKFWESYMFYIIVFKTAFLIGAMIHGYNLDKEKPQSETENIEKNQQNQDQKKQEEQQEDQGLQQQQEQLQKQGQLQQDDKDEQQEQQEQYDKQLSSANSKQSAKLFFQESKQMTIRQEEDDITSKSQDQSQIIMDFEDDQKKDTIKNSISNSQNTQNSINSYNKNVKRRRTNQFIQQKSTIQQSFFDKQKQQEEKLKEEQELEQQQKFKEELEKKEKQKARKLQLKKEKRKLMKQWEEEKGKVEKLPEQTLQSINELYSQKGMESLEVINIENDDTTTPNNNNINKLNNNLQIDPIIENDQESSMEQSTKQQQILQFTESSSTDSNLGKSKLEYSSELENSQKIEKSFQQLENAQDINISSNLGSSPSSSKEINIQQQKEQTQKQNNILIQSQNQNPKEIENNDPTSQKNQVQKLQRNSKIFNLSPDQNIIQSQSNDSIKNDNEIQQTQNQQVSLKIINLDSKNDVEKKNNINSIIDAKNDLEKKSSIQISQSDVGSKNNLIITNQQDSKCDIASFNQENTINDQNLKKSNDSPNQQYTDNLSKYSNSFSQTSNQLKQSQEQMLKNEQSFEDSIKEQDKDIQVKQVKPVKSKQRKSILILQQQPKARTKSFLSIKKKEQKQEEPVNALPAFSKLIIDDIKKEEIKESIEKDPAFKKPIQEHKIRHVSEGIIQFHEFFSIFYIKDKKISRPVRFAIYYFKITLLIAISGLFSQNTSFIQSIILSIISSIFLIIPMNLIVIMYKSPKQFLKKCSIFLLISIQLVIIYTILVTAAVMGVEKSNEWVQSYVYTFITNFFIIVPLEIAIVLNIIKYGMVKGKKNIMIDEENQAQMIQFLYQSNE